MLMLAIPMIMEGLNMVLLLVSITMMTWLQRSIPLCIISYL
ncbi:hypothetical protein A2U01_0117668, partial [Trifolium medium]|nr:hypothetical protein [Trifolium medium]